MISSLTIFTYLLILFGSVYLILIISYTWGWYHLRSFIPNPKGILSVRASIIIPARNEEKNILFLLNDLAKQHLENKYFEIIIVDDNSSDNTANIVRQFIIDHADLSVKMISLADSGHTQTYKKHAITTAIAKSTGDLIITTDADCRVGVNWVAHILHFYQEQKPKMIIAPVAFHNEKTLFEKMQSLEFLSLIAITGGAIRIGKPVMCNGANLAYEKKAFFETGGFDQDSFASGDDVFLLLKMQKKFGSRSILFLKNTEAIVYTEAQKTISSFYQQRTRWASKNKGYDLKILFVSFTVYMVNLLLVAGFIFSIFQPEILELLVISVFVKIFIDLPILIGITTFARRMKMFLYGFPLIFFYPVYIVLIGALGILGNYQWKGRKIKK